MALIMEPHSLILAPVHILHPMLLEIPRHQQHKVNSTEVVVILMVVVIILIWEIVMIGYLNWDGHADVGLYHWGTLVLKDP